MQHDLSVKVSPDLDRRDARHDCRCDVTQRLQISLLIRSLTEPMGVFRGNNHRTLESAGPGRVRGVVMWMRYHDGDEAAFGIDLNGELSQSCAQHAKAS